MDIVDTLVTRRSIRKYTDKPIDEETIKELVRAGCYAPSAVDKRPWEFLVLKDRKVLENIAQIHPHAKMLLQAPCAILVCGTPEKAHTPDYLPLDLSAATQNILIAAHGRSLGACWLGVYPRRERMLALRELLGIPMDVVPFALIALGHPAEEKHAAERFSEKFLHYNRW
jgi:nitroreductase